MIIRPFVLAALAASIAAAPALAQSPPADTRTDPAAVRAGDYKLEPTHARVLFSLSHMGLSTWYGEFTQASGTGHFDPANPAANRVEITLQAASLSTSNAKLDGELKGASHFDVAKFPTITFKSTKVAPTGPGRADVTGDLTFHGVTKPVTLHVKFNAALPHPMTKIYSLGFDATGEIIRSQFGVGAMAPMIGDKVSLMITAPFEAAAK